MNFKKHLDQHAIFSVIAKASENIETYIVGGYVRDLILKRKTQDIDIVCVGSGIQLAQKVAKLLGPGVVVNVYKNFGTASIHHKNYNIEFVGARKESYRADSRKPIVENGTLEDDQNRRDFTINALAISINTHNFGQLIDPFNGIADLRKKIIKTPLTPDTTFSDDPLRMMRAVRFASQLDFDIEADTFESITKQKERLTIISHERITEELNKIILSNKPSYGFKLLFHSGLLHIFFPELVELQGVETLDGKGHKDNFYHTLQVLDNVARDSDSLWLRWAAILHDIAKPATKRYDKKAGWTFHGHEDKGARMVPGIFRRFKLPMNEKMKYVQKLVKLHLRPIVLAREDITDSALRRLLFEAGNDVNDLMILCRADITSKNMSKVQRFLSNFDLVEKRLADVEQRDQIKNFQPPVSGELIMDFFSIKPSREVGEIKEAIKEAILDGKIGNNFDEAFELMKRLGIEKGLMKHGKNN
ncbi:MAG: HD domain-containing protein [Cyclobacteriaceae bacterium]|nr:HD domain-containing protein [Cyclobacteriaceae bacterium]